MSRYVHRALLALALVFAVLVGYADLHSDDLFIVAGLIVGGAFVLGAIEPSEWWLWGVLVGVGVPAAETIAAAAHIPVPYASEDPTLIGMLVIFVACFVLAFTGSICGGLVRRVILAKGSDAW